MSIIPAPDPVDPFTGPDIDPFTRPPVGTIGGQDFHIVDTDTGPALTIPTTILTDLEDAERLTDILKTYRTDRKRWTLHN